MTDEDLAHARLGRTLRDKYTLERLLGVGGMGAVYAATHRNRKQFAVKVLHALLSANPEIRERFLREGRVANTVAHAGAVAVLDDDVAEDGSAFLVMELLDGTSVEDLWQRRGLSLRATLALAEQLLEVLEAAHARGIVHRDLKPANLFITTEGVLKVLDFGIARLREPQVAHATQTGAALGTPGFMAPEQARGETTQLDGLADLWAVGATLFQLLSGQLVHSGDNALQLLVQSATQPARSLGSVTTQLPAAVVALVDRALAFDKAARWPDAAAMRAQVQQARAALAPGLPLESAVSVLRTELRGPAATTLAAEPAPPTSAGATGDRPGRRRWLLGAAAASGVAVLLGVGLRMSSAPAERAGTSSAQLPATTAVQPERRRDEPALPGRDTSAAAGPAPQPGAALPVGAQAPTAASKPIAPQPSPAPARAAPPPLAATAPGGVQKPMARPQPPRPAAAVCARLLERQSLGETLSSEELVQLRDLCR